VGFSQRSTVSSIGSENDRAEAGLRGRVRTCGTEMDYVYPDHHWVMYTNDTFSPQGHLLERRHRNPDGSQWSIVCRYDEQWRINEKQHAGEQPEANQLFLYRYDSLGRLAQVLQRSPDGERVSESVQYRADGTKTITSYQVPLSETERRSTGVSADAMLHMSMDAVVIMTVCAASGRPIRKVLYDVDERVIRRVAFRYDERGASAGRGRIDRRVSRAMAAGAGRPAEYISVRFGGARN